MIARGAIPLQVESVRVSVLLRGVGVLISLPLFGIAGLFYVHVAQDATPVRPADLPAIVSADVSIHRLAIQRAALRTMTNVESRARDSRRSRVVPLHHVAAALVLEARARPYRVRDLLRFSRAAVMSRKGKTLTVRRSIVVRRGAELLLDSRQVPQILLSSTHKNFASIVGLGGTIRFSGSSERPLRVSSLRGGTRDTKINDGRAFILDKSGRMVVDHTHFSYLGFGTGNTSGVAWAGTPQSPVHGEVTNSSFSHNHFGAYTFEARGMLWDHNVFSTNDAYGFDPHDFSNGFVVSHNLAYANGRHGIIFSRGCRKDKLLYNTSRDNQGHGFMIDDGNNTVVRGGRRWVASSHNLLLGNVATKNGRSGIEIEGGRRNDVVRNVVDGNYLGIRYRFKASGRVAHNTVESNRLYGVDVEATAGSVSISDNVGSGSWSDLTLFRPALVSGNAFAVVQGESTASGHRKLTGPLPEAAAFLDYHPGIAVWLVILWVPLASVILHRRPRRRFRHRSLQGT